MTFTNIFNKVIFQFEMGHNILNSASAQIVTESGHLQFREKKLTCLLDDATNKGIEITDWQK
jgi:hypothetical protein